MDIKISESKLLREQIKRSNEHGELMLQMFDEFQDMKNDMELKHKKMTGMIERIEETYPINNAEAEMLHSEIVKKGWMFAKQYFDERVSDSLFHSKRTHLQSGIKSLTRKKFKAIKFTTIRHLDFDNATEYVKSLELMDLPKNYLRLTDSQEERAEKNGDNISSIKKDDPPMSRRLI